jgi:glycosyltransferase 2 family protein
LLTRLPPTVRRALAVTVVGLVALSIGLAVASQWSRLPNFEWRFAPGWLALSLLAFAVFQAAHAELWRLILVNMGERLAVLPALAIWSVTLLGRYVPTGALMVVGRVAMAQREGVARRVCLASVVYEVALTGVGALALGSWFALTLPALEDRPERYAILALPIGALIALHPRIFHPLADRVLDRVGRDPLPRVVAYRRVLLLALGFLSTFVVAGAGVYCFAQAIYEVGSDDLSTFVAAYSVAWIVSVLGFFSPAGLGAREAGLTAALVPVMPLAAAAAVTVGVRLVQIGLELLFAAVSPLAAGRRFRWRREQAPQPSGPEPDAR